MIRPGEEFLSAFIIWGTYAPVIEIQQEVAPEIPKPQA
jgi:hypothetical protein